MHNDKERPKATSRSKADRDFVIDCIVKIAIASNVAMNEEAIRIYVEELLCLSRVQMTQATNRTIREWSEASKLPPIAFILERGYAGISPEVTNDSPHIFSRQELTDSAKRRGVTEEEIQEWLEAGKTAQQEHYARLAEDPKWREMAERLGGFPGLKKRLPPTEAPDDPEKRRNWASGMAKKQGWKE